MKWMTNGKTAVISGGASGIGLESAKRFLACGMNVVIADVKNLTSAKESLLEISNDESKVLIQECDVTSFDAIKELEIFVQESFGKVHCLMGNAGMIAMGTKPWEEVEQLHKIMNTNFMGVVNLCNAFIPSMIAHGEDGVVINTGSKQGITRPPGNYAYNLSKASVVAYTEALSHAFIATENCKIKSHLLIPAFVYTPMISAFIPEKPDFAATTEETVDYFLEALKRDEFYILCPDNETNREMDEKRIQWAADDIIKNRPAMSRWHPDYQEEFEAFMK
jgi:NAD(P)-dependent dehydrogenase (short-subunit alcohol dehydrogenase family)